MDVVNTILGGLKHFRETVAHNLLSIAIAVGASGILLLNLPKAFIDIFYLNDFRTANSEIIGVVTFVAVMVAISRIIYVVTDWTWEKIKTTRNYRQLERDQRILLEALTPLECYYLAQYVAEQTQTAYFPPTDGVISGLEGKGIVYKASSIGYMEEFAYNLQPWAYKLLCENPAILNGKIEQLGKSLERQIPRRGPWAS